MGNKVSTRITNNEVEALLNTMKRGTEIVENSKNAKIAKGMIYGFNARDVDSIIKACSSDAVFGYEGSDDVMPLDTFLLIAETMFVSFPDVIISFDTMKEESPGVVKVRGVRTRGTHTGKPYGFAQFPPVPTTNILVEDIAEYTFHVSNGKCTKLVLAMVKEGDLIGPAGYYVKIGGKLSFA